MEIQQDERGDGVILLPDAQRRKVRVGTKLASTSVKRSESEPSAAGDALNSPESSCSTKKL